MKEENKIIPDDIEVNIIEEKLIETEDIKNINEMISKDTLKEFKNVDEFYTKNKESLMLYQETKHEMFEKLRLNWSHNHKRIQDFNQKRIMKFPQIYYLNYETIYDNKRKIIENKSNLISKYTFNLENDIEVDIGGILSSRDNLGLGSIFSSTRFYLFKNRLFNSFSYQYGEMKNFTYETNYLFTNSLLLDYIYRNKNLSENKHKVTLHKLWNNNTKLNGGFSVLNNFENFGLNLSGKKYLKAKTQSVEGKIKLDFEEIKIEGKFKENVIRNLYLLTSHKIVFSFVFPVFSSHNEIVYKYHNRFFNFGYFYNFDGFGIEFGYRSGGVHINLPLKLFIGDLNFQELVDKSFSENIFNFVKQVVFFAGLNFITKLAIKKIKQYLKNKNKNNVISVDEKFKRNIIEVRNYQDKIISQITQQAEKNQKIELEKNLGLIINFAIYGRKKTLVKIMNESHLIEKTKVEEYLKNLVDDIENEIVNVTIPVKYLIRRDDKASISSILFHQVPKTKIVGFVNPIFKNEKEPYLLINYSIGGNNYTIIKADSEVFQIPQTFNI